MTRHLVHFLDVAMSRVGRPAGDPQVLLATLPGEQHSLGLLMAEVLLMQAGTATSNLGTDVPLEQIVAAAERSGVSTVALSFSACYARGLDSGRSHGACGSPSTGRGPVDWRRECAAVAAPATVGDEVPRLALVSAGLNGGSVGRGCHSKWRRRQKAPGSATFSVGNGIAEDCSIRAV